MKIKIFNTALIRPTLSRYCKAPRIVLIINELKRRRISVVKCDFRFTTEPYSIQYIFNNICHPKNECTKNCTKTTIGVLVLEYANSLYSY